MLPSTLRNAVAKVPLLCIELCSADTVRPSWLWKEHIQSQSMCGFPYLDKGQSGLEAIFHQHLAPVCGHACKRGSSQYPFSSVPLLSLDQSCYSLWMGQLAVIIWSISSLFQDTVRGGMRGTQQQCLMLARQVLEGGGCVIIDRCHVEPDQRKNFLHLARILKIQVDA